MQVKNLTQAKKALSLKNIWNRTIEINGLFIRGKMWDNNQWQVVDSLDFDTANIIKDFYYQNDLAKYIIDNSK